MNTNIQDRFRTWAMETGREQSQELYDAFAEGFAQAMEWLSGETRA